MIQKITTICVVFNISALFAVSPPVVHAGEKSAAAACSQASPTKKDLERAEALAKEGTVAFRLQQYGLASAKFAEAYACSKRPATYYNAGRAYEETGNYKMAIAIFREYITLPEAEPEGIKAAKLRLEVLEKMAKSPSTDEVKPPKEVIKKPEEVNPHKATERATNPVEQKAGKPPATSLNDNNQLTAYVVAGSGAVVTGVGVWLILSGRSIIHEANNAPLVGKDAPNKYEEETNTGTTRQGIGIASIACGAAAIGTSAWLWLRKRPTSDGAVVLAPSFGDKQIGMVFTGRF